MDQQAKLESVYDVLSPQVEAAVRCSIEFSSGIALIHPQEGLATFRDDIAARYFSMALDHREAILLLVLHGARSSAYALVRSVYEACLRGLWTKFAAHEQALLQLQERGVVPKFETVVQQVRRGKIGNTFASTKADVWEAFSDYSHGGPRQLSRWSSKNEIGAAHPDKDIPGMLLALDIYAYFAMVGLFATAALDAAPVDDLFNRLVEPRVHDFRTRKKVS